MIAMILNVMVVKFGSVGGNKEVVVYKYLITAIVISLILSTGISAKKNDRTIYWIDGGRTMLAFIGNPNSLKLKPVKFTTSRMQTIKLLHKKSGPGIWAFKLPGLVIVDSFGQERFVMTNGYILVKKKWIRSTKWKKKVSLKYRTMKGALNDE